ncbi:MAG: VPLPA-CTERM sorting domain-containing protein [Pseudomonadota bacterium]
MSFKGTAAGVAALFFATSASAVTLDVMVWDIVAPEPGCCAGNDEGEQLGDGVARQNDVVLSPGGNNNFFDTALTNGTSAEGLDEAGVDYIVDNLDADLSFQMDSSDLAAGFSALGLTNSAAQGGPTINDFFGLGDLGGVGANSILGTIVKITGTIAIDTGDFFSITSDDGYRLTVNGEILDEVSVLQAPKTKDTGAYPLASGNVDFELLWFEDNRVKAALKMTPEVQPVPLPAGLPLLLAGLGAMGLAARKKRTA